MSVIAGSDRDEAVCIDKIIKGTKSADLPVGQPTKFNPIISRRTATAISIDVPAQLLARAGEVIE